ncbi:MAG: hypothetical protein IJM76_07665 [Lachnospiraceae bacterium]|nr:hypothetical protein [Lachnospiraceae bacterium]
MKRMMIYPDTAQEAGKRDGGYLKRKLTAEGLLYKLESEMKHRSWRRAERGGAQKAGSRRR